MSELRFECPVHGKLDDSGESICVIDDCGQKLSLIDLDQDEKCMVCFRIGWMAKYQGMNNDKIEGGGPDKDSSHWELYNFLPCNGYVYGFGASKKISDNPYNTSIDLSRVDKIGGILDESDDYLDDVTVVWVSKNPVSEEMVVIGWYKNAELFKRLQDFPRECVGRKDEEGCRIQYIAKAKENDALLLPLDKRTFPVKDKFGECNLWHPDPTFKKKIIEFIKTIESERT